eukprot:SAG31_NODE_22358_length_527_cov_1.063084_1_plen_99_part_01
MRAGLLFAAMAAAATTASLAHGGGTADANVYALNGTVAYTLYAESFEGSCWGQKINAAINHAMEFGSGTATIQLPPGDLNVSTPIRFARTQPGGVCARL